MSIKYTQQNNNGQGNVPQTHSLTTFTGVGGARCKMTTCTTSKFQLTGKRKPFSLTLVPAVGK